jgi:Thiamine pyrophosphate enzyme, N-terminal TPP binding domain
MTVAARSPQPVSTEEPVGDLIAHALAEIGVTTVFGVISIHNMPILDAIARHNRIRFVPARGEAGATNMADAYARVSRSLGVVITSTGTAAGNAAGSQVEALTAGSPVLHITSQIDRPWMDRDRAAIHDVPRQADMLRAVSKAYFRVWEGRTAVGMVVAAARAALTAPRAGRCRSKFRSTCSARRSRGPAMSASARSRRKRPIPLRSTRSPSSCAMRGGRCCGSAAARVTRAARRSISPSAASPS